MFCRIKKLNTFASHLRENVTPTRAFSSAGSEHLPYKQRVGGSNPSTPTTEKRLTRNCESFLFLFLPIFRWFLFVEKKNNIQLTRLHFYPILLLSSYKSQLGIKNRSICIIVKISIIIYTTLAFYRQSQQYIVLPE